MSRPNHALAFGVSRACLRIARSGGTLVNSDGQMAISTKVAIRSEEIQKIGFFLSCFQASDPSERASSCWPGSRWVSAAISRVDDSVMADPRVEHAVQEVDEQVHDQEDEHQDGHGAHDTHRVAVADAGEQEATD